MSSLSVSLSDDDREVVEAEVAAGRYDSPSSYIHDLIHADQKRKARQKVEAMLLEALRKPATEMTEGDWADLRRELEERIEAQLIEGLNSPSEEISPEWWDRFRAELHSRPGRAVTS